MHRSLNFLVEFDNPLEDSRPAGLEFTEDERDVLAKGLNGFARQYETLREIPLPNSVAPAWQFNRPPR